MVAKKRPFWNGPNSLARVFLPMLKTKNSVARLTARGGVAFNLTLLSYRGNLDMGINTDAAAITEPELFARSINGAIADFISA